jgi:hypothetical protein
VACGELHVAISIAISLVRAVGGGCAIACASALHPSIVLMMEGEAKETTPLLVTVLLPGSVARDSAAGATQPFLRLFAEEYAEVSLKMLAVKRGGGERSVREAG